MTKAIQKTEKPGTVKSLLASDAFRQQVAVALPRHMTVDRMMRVALTALLRTPALANCKVESVARAMLDCSAMGLEPDGRRAHLVPYKDVCTLIIDYKGLIELAKRNGDVALWRPVAVKAADKFCWVNGDVTHEIDWRKERGELQCVYSHVRTKDGQDDYEVMTLSECKAIQARSPAGRGGPWVSDFEAMALKTVMRRHAKRLVLSPEFADALDRDGDRLDAIQHIDVETVETVQEAEKVLKSRAKPAKDATKAEKRPAAATEEPIDPDTGASDGDSGDVPPFATPAQVQMLETARRTKGRTFKAACDEAGIDAEMQPTAWTFDEAAAVLERVSPEI